MILSDIEIIAELSKRELVVHPILSVSQIQGCKIDVRLSNTFYLIRHTQKSHYDPMSPAQEEVRERFVVPYRQNEGFTIQPGEFATAPLLESVRIPLYLKGTLDGRSSLGRLGLGVHVTAGTVDPGFSGQLTCELANLGKIPVKLYPLQRIGSIILEKLGREAKFGYGNRPIRKYGSFTETGLAADYEFSKEIPAGKDPTGKDKPLESIMEMMQESP